MEREFTVDIQNFRTTNEEVNPNPILEDANPAKVSNQSTNVDWSVNGGKLENLEGKAESGNNVSAENMQVLIEIEKNVIDPLEKKIKKDKRKTMSAKKHPKPPRPPRGLSLDAADQKLIKELAELAMIKRARIERMKALKKMKAAKGSSSFSSASGGSFFAILLTVLFCVVMVCQGMSSRVNSDVSFSSSLASPEAVENSFMAVEKHMILSNSHNVSNSTSSGSSRVTGWANFQKTTDE